MSNIYKIGRLVQLGTAKETTRGTTPASASFWPAWEGDLVLDENRKSVADESTYGIIENAIDEQQVKRWVEGTLKGPITDTSFGLMLYSIFGGYAHGTHSGESVVYDHTFTVAESAQHQSLSLYIHDTSVQDYSHANCIVHKLELEYALQKFVSFSASIMGLKGAAQSAYSPSVTQENRFPAPYATLGIAQTVAGVNGTLTATGTAASTIHVTALSISTTLLQVGMTVTGTNVPTGATIVAIVSATAFDLSAATTGAVGTMTFGALVVPVKSMKLTIDAGGESFDVLGSLDPSDFFNKEFKVTGTIEAIFRNESDFKTQFLSTDSQTFQIILKNTSITLGTSTNPALTITLDQVYITKLPLKRSVKDLVYQTVTFEATYSIANSEMIKAVLTNTTSSF